jgi:hypothetical protein
MEVMEEIIQPACAALGIRPLRADEIAEPGEIPEQIFTHLRDDEIVIADLTGANANVMYELGLRHTTGRLTIQIGELDRLPFDVAAIRTIRFKRSPSGLVSARKALTAALSAGLDKGGHWVAATRIWMRDSLATSQQAVAECTESDEAGFLEKLADMDKGVTSIVGNITTLTTIMHEISAFVSIAGGQMDRLNKQKGPPAAKVEVANHLAKQLEAPAERLESTVASFSRNVELCDPGVRHFLVALKAHHNAEEAEAFRQAVKGASKSVGDALPGAEALRDRMLESGDATRLLRKINTRLAAAMSDYIVSAKRVADWQNLE